MERLEELGTTNSYPGGIGGDDDGLNRTHTAQTIRTTIRSLSLARILDVFATHKMLTIGGSHAY